MKCKHEHIGFYEGTGEPQTCHECRYTVAEIVSQAYEEGKREAIEEVRAWVENHLSAVVGDTKPPFRIDYIDKWKLLDRLDALKGKEKA